MGDAYRWRQLVGNITTPLGYTQEKIAQLMQAIVIWQDSEAPLFLGKEFIIGLSSNYQFKEGYKIVRFWGKYQGEKLAIEEAQHIVDYMKVFFLETRRHNVLGYVHVPVCEEDLKNACVVRARFADLPKSESIARQREHTIGEIVNNFQGELMSTIGGDFICLFRHPPLAFACAVSLQNVSGMWKIALDFGPVMRELCCRGFYLTGVAVQNCHKLLEDAFPSNILFSSAFIQHLNEYNNVK